MTERISRELVLKAMEILADQSIGQSVGFAVAGTNNRAMLRLEKGCSPESAVYLTTGAIARGDNHLVQHFYHHAASMDEMSVWLRDAGNADGIAESLAHLSDRVDQGFD